jgi:hypothetical protein
MCSRTLHSHSLPCHALPCHALPCHALPCHALPCHALPCHALPSRALKLISEYSKPITRGDWRTFSRSITIGTYINDINNITRFKTYALYKLVYTHMRQSPFYMLYHHLYCFGIDDYIKTYGGDKTRILANTILNARNESYIEYSKNIYCNKIWIV